MLDSLKAEWPEMLDESGEVTVWGWTEADAEEGRQAISLAPALDNEDAT